RRPPAPARGESGGTEHVRDHPDAACFEEGLPRRLADVRAFDLPSRDDPRRLERLEWDVEAVRDVHEAPERQDPESRLGPKEGDRGRRDRAIAFGDEPHAKALGDRVLPEAGGE